MSWTGEWKWLAAMTGGFLAVFWLPVGTPRFDQALLEGVHLAKWYAREHVLLCLVPALFIAGAIAVFVGQAAVTKYLGAGANRVLAYGVASVSGSILAVCSCTVLPLFAGIYRMGAGLGPAAAFLYAGPAINVLAVILTARVLGLEMGVARAVAAVLFSIVIGLAMHALFRREEGRRATTAPVGSDTARTRPLSQDVLYFGSMVAVLVFANWGPPQGAGAAWAAVYNAKWMLTGLAALVLAVAMVRYVGLSPGRAATVGVATATAALAFPSAPLVPFTVALVALSGVTSTAKGEAGEWFAATWGLAKQIVPLLLVGVLIAGALLGRPGHEGLVPSSWVAGLVGGNSLQANVFASVVGALMYFATLTEVPILEGLLASGMGKGPALALLLAGPALSLPSMLVIHGIIGFRKTVAFVGLVVTMATISGLVFGSLF